MIAVESFVDDVLSAWHEPCWSEEYGPLHFSDFKRRHWNSRLVLCRRASAHDYLVKCWQDKEEPDARILGNVVCPWRVSHRSWKRV